jgi:geranylgeranyl pyrophosphate synthase
MLQKPVRMDLGKGKPTILGAKAYDSLKATPNGLEKIGKQSLVKLTMSRNILDAANQLANEYAHRAIAAVIDLRSTPGKRCLVELAEKATRRDS